MWALRVLNGPQAGQFYVLKQGKNKIGRAATCDFVVTAPGVSKDHIEVTVYPDKVVFIDLNSSNGTFLNGVRVKNGIVRIGDKLGMHQVMLDLVMVQESSQVEIQAPPPQQNNTPQPQFAQPNHGALVPFQHGAPAQAYPPQQSQNYPQGQAPFNGQAQGQFYPAAQQNQMGMAQQMAYPNMQNMGQMHHQKRPSGMMSLLEKIQNYIERVAMPGVYRMAEVFEMRTVIYGFGALFILIITVLSIFPMKQITSESVSTESRRRAMTVARALSQANERTFKSGDISSFSTDLVLREDGIDDVYIVSKDGTIVAPTDRVGMVPREAGFLKRVRMQDKQMVDEVGGRVVAAVPILGFDSELQMNVAKAYTVIVYNPGNLTFDDGRALALFIQMLALALIVGGFLFFLLNKLIEYPIKALNESLDEAMREGSDNATVRIRFPVLQNLLTNINSLLARALAASQSNQPSVDPESRLKEQVNLFNLIGSPALMISADRKLLMLNQGFERLTGMMAANLVGQDIAYIPDQALQKNILELTSAAETSRDSIVQDQLEIGGTNYYLNCQAIFGIGGSLERFILAFQIANEDAQGGAA